MGNDIVVGIGMYDDMDSGLLCSMKLNVLLLIYIINGSIERAQAQHKRRIIDHNECL